MELFKRTGPTNYYVTVFGNRMVSESITTWNTTADRKDIEKILFDMIDHALK
ncbi:MAG TPA: hypothetical protein PKH23_05990 [Bacillota bacterium]|nr:hypothetical protein [Bacillota bacterium]